jgi:hypothetical protein
VSKRKANDSQYNMVEKRGGNEMSIRINGYDIYTYEVDADETRATFAGIAHLENGPKTADIPFSGRHVKGMIGFIEFSLQDTDEIDVEDIQDKSDLIRDVLADHLLQKGYESGEYFDIIPVQQQS